MRRCVSIGGTCYHCGKDVDLPFKCTYCGLFFCDEHRLPEQHKCINLPKRRWDSYKKIHKGKIISHPKKEEIKYHLNVPEHKVSYKSSNSIKGKLILLFIIVGIVGILYVQYNSSIIDLDKYSQQIGEVIGEGFKGLKEATTETREKISETIENLTPEPTTYEELIQYALDEINKERTKHGVQNVTLSPINCGQSHAEHLLENKYLSHWGTDGLKPYMRYTLAGGKGSVGENCAWWRSTGTIDPFEAIERLSWGMVYDDAGSDWGHRDNLLGPHHNRVSIGIAWDSNNLFLVQDFEDYYFAKAEVDQIGSEIELEYTSTKSDWKPEQIAIYYDPLPVPLSVEVLSNPPYDDGYDQGTFVGAVLPEGYYIIKGITITAEVWSSRGSEFRVKFDLSKAYQRGEGVYTLLIWESNKIYTTYSIWYQK